METYSFIKSFENDYYKLFSRYSRNNDLRISFNKGDIEIKITLKADEMNEPMTERQRDYIQTFITHGKRIKPSTLDKDTARRLLMLLTGYRDELKEPNKRLLITARSSKDYRNGEILPF